jgi:hypothetical protein
MRSRITDARQMDVDGVALQHRMYAGKQCQFGHGGIRYKANRGCVECCQEANRRRRKSRETSKAAFSARSASGPGAPPDLARGRAHLLPSAWGDLMDTKQRIDLASRELRITFKPHPGGTLAECWLGDKHCGLNLMKGPGQTVGSLLSVAQIFIGIAAEVDAR